MNIIRSTVLYVLDKRKILWVFLLLFYECQYTESTIDVCMNYINQIEAAYKSQLSIES